MRLIDADQIPFLSIPVAPVMTTDTDVVFRAGAFKEDVDRVPTVDTAKRGHWMFRTDGNFYGMYKCSVCRDTVPKPSRYCPMCGAKMD